MTNNSPNSYGLKDPRGLSPNQLINGHVPKNVSKYVIHQTFNTIDSERTGTNGYRFKMPEVWTSARSAKKVIAVRKIDWISKREYLKFEMVIRDDASQTLQTFLYVRYVPANNSMMDILDDILSTFQKWVSDNKFNFLLSIEYVDNCLKLSVDPLSDSTKTYQFKIIDFTSGSPATSKVPSASWNKILNQPLNTFHDFTPLIEYENVWDRNTSLHFHASFIPFDTYQYLGTLSDTWQNPIIYQDPNSSPLFNIWITSDLKRPLSILHETFIFRISFIISSESCYA